MNWNKLFDFKKIRSAVPSRRSAYHINMFPISRQMLPHIPEKAQNIIVNQFTATLTPVIPESRLTANSDPSPERTEVDSALKK